MECFWDKALIEPVAELPHELIETIRRDNQQTYLSAITKVALDARYTYTLLAHCGNVFSHICATLRQHGSYAAAVATLGRVVPFAPHLGPYAERLLRDEAFIFNASSDPEEIALYLLGLFRLLQFDSGTFTAFVDPNLMSEWLGNPRRDVRYLAIRVLQISLSGADHWFEAMIRRYLGDDTPDSVIDGPWDDKVIDYRFLSLWEEQMRERYTKLASAANQARGTSSMSPLRVLSEENFHASTALVGGILFPRDGDSVSSVPLEALVSTHTTAKNLTRIAEALTNSRPLLLTGLAGVGKTALIRHIAGKLGKLDSMVSLHLNEQSDVKLLVGIYTTGDSPGSFVWKPGVLTTAVQEGRWVVIEDLDRAPQHIIGSLLPLIEHGRLSIPHRKQTIQARQGFRIIATARSVLNHRGEEVRQVSHMLGRRHWQDVPVDMPHIDEHHEIANRRFPALTALLPQFMATYERLRELRLSPKHANTSQTGLSRPISLRDLLKWCARAANLLDFRRGFSTDDSDNIFLEAVDCFAGFLPDGPTRKQITALLAEELYIDPQRRDYLLVDRAVRYGVDKAKISVGRYDLPRGQTSKRALEGNFSTNPHTTRMLERVAAAVKGREPLLLVGETGVGKTTAVQHLATHLGKKLVPFNLSQQSEAGDLLGGFKPVNVRTFIVPMKDEFDDLFAASFSQSKNRHFLELLGKNASRGNWKAVCKLWRQALKMVEQQRASLSRKDDVPSKKRKVDNTQSIDYVRWDTFAEKTEDMERRLSGGTNGFAFSFVEGNIVKAVRNGDWVLLDEINLASPDTLEALTDLLDPAQPSLLLPEAGDIKRIVAHPDFRVFAAMNPATDVGKKDLLPGIRSRFTELYVESPDKDINSLQSIVRTYLRQQAHSDLAVSVDTATLYQEVIALAEQNKLVDGAGQRPHFSLRTLTRTLSYTNHIAPLCSLRRALYEGFQMCFMTFLDIESAALVQPLLEQHLFGKRSNFRAELRKTLRKPHNEDRYVQAYPGSMHWVRRGAFALKDESHYIITPFIQRNLENLVRAVSTRQFPVLIQGPTSSGKTSMIEYLAKRTGHEFVRINNHEHTDLQEYLGTYVSGVDGRLQFQDGVLVKALREGHWLVLDELNLAPSDVLEALNRLLDDNRELLVPETQETIRPHQDFMLFATQNPAGFYGGRKTLSRAFRNRFLELHFDDIPIDELQEILHKRTQLPESRCKRIVSVYRELSILRQENRLFEQKSFATLRDLFRWASRPNDTLDQLASNGFMLLAERVRKPEERDMVKTVLEKIMSANGPRVKIDENTLYSPDAAELKQCDQNATDHGVVWTKAMRRLYLLVSRALQSNEPILLVGETGCGKTTVCQMLAAATGKHLHMVNAHQNTETGDLIGSQRPVRNKAAVEAQLRQWLLSSPILESLATASILSTEALALAYDQAVTALPEHERRAYLTSETHAEVQDHLARFNALFEWVDGSLIQAMKTGSFFLLDEISLADDSVLERLNSVLEPSRSILLAEKGSLDAFITASSGFQFFATMNPGGDYSKRELSPALRNRFTEIWVPAMSDIEDLVQIVKAKLVPGARGYADGMISFAQWFNNSFNTSAMFAVSIRDVLAWASFINAFDGADVEAAVVHGAAMVYIDTLGANPAGLMTLTGEGLKDERERCLSELEKRTHVNAMHIYQQSFQVTITASALAIGPFRIDSTSGDVAPNSSFSFDAPTTRQNAMRVVRAMQLSKAVMLEGSPGVGKTALVTAVAGAVGMPLTRINLSEQTDLMDLFGSDAPVEGAEAGTFAWQDAPFLRAMKNGEWVLLDEMNLASQSVLEGLNAVLDHRGQVFVPEVGQTFAKHHRFRLFAAQNPHYQGGGRKGLPASFVNRFTVVYADAFQPEDLMLICSRLYPTIPAEYIAQAVRFVHVLDAEVVQHKRFGASGGPWEFNLRDVARWLALASSEEGLLRAGNARDFADLLFKDRFRSARDRALLQDAFRSVFGDASSPADLSVSVSGTVAQVGLGILPRNLVDAQLCSSLSSRTLSTDRLRTTQALIVCIQKGWPIVLTGASGAGKSAIINSVASVVGASVETCAMNAETDAMDLIGGYEQSDPYRRALQMLEALNNKLNTMAKSALVQGPSEECLNYATSLKKEVRAFNAGTSTWRALRDCLLATPVAGVEELLEMIEHASKAVDKARFSWIDGILIDAMQEGKWLVLDNANLCSPSVLDRLNSLLETEGSLIVNEHAGVTGAPRVVVPHPGFRIFLTVDPRYGELSRAMRNRAVELHLLENSEREGIVEQFSTESRIHRFRRAKVFDTVEISEAHPERSSAMLLDFLGVSDEPLLPRFYGQLQHGLYGGLPQVQSARPDAQHVRASMPDTSREKLKALHESAISRRRLPADFACVQTAHPLNNQPLLQQDETILARFLQLAFAHDISRAVASLFKATRLAKANRAVVSRLVRLERQMFPASGPRATNESARSLGAIEVALTTSLEWAFQMSSINPQTLSKTRAAASLFFVAFRVLLDIISREDVDVCSLSAGLSLTRDAVLFSDVEILDSRLFATRQALSLLTDKSKHAWGSECSVLWRSLKPPTPKSTLQLRRLLDFEKRVVAFDRIAFRLDQPLETLTNLRQSFQRALRIAGGAGDTLEQLATHLDDLIDASKWEEQGDPPPNTPHFVLVFKRLLEHFNTLLLVEGRALPTNLSAPLELLALMPTLECAQNRGEVPAAGFAPFQLLSTIQRDGAPFDDTSLVNKVQQSLARTDEVFVERLPLLSSEMELLTEALFGHAHLIMEDNSEALDKCLHQLVCRMLEILIRFSENKAVVDAAAHLFTALRNTTATPMEFPGGRLDSGNNSLELLAVAVVHLTSVYASTHEQASGASRAWIALSIACLKFYLPATPFDPALESILKVTTHDRCQEEMGHNLKTLQLFMTRLTGEASTLRLRILEADLDGLGERPDAPDVCRPQHSQIVQLHADFELLKQVLEGIESTLQHPQGFFVESNVVINVQQLRSRLIQNHRPYADLTAPAVYFIDCLTTGISLVRKASAKQTFSSASTVLANLTPFCAGRLSTWADDNTLLETLAANGNQEQRLSWLSILAHRNSVRPLHDSASNLRFWVEEQFGRFYEQWRRELNIDQKRHADKSSLYRYRGGEDAEEDTAEQLADLFPTYDEDGEATLDSETPWSRAQNIAVPIAAAHRNIFRRQELAAKNLLGSLGDLGKGPLPFPPIEAGPGLPTLLISVNELATNLKITEASSQRYNVYRDPNCGQVEKLRQVVQKCRRQFRKLHQDWPEHATPVLVIQYCDRILTLSHAEPVMRFLPHVEKLHGAVNEWQKIASREYSVSSLLDTITDLIITWRRLELSAWASLFEHEDRRSLEDAASWWFVAYETIIAATPSSHPTAEIFETHVVELLGGLQSFLENCGLGEYHSRLEMLRSFESQMAVNVVHHGHVNKVRQGIANFIAYFARFEPSVSKTLATGRASLQKEMMSIIQVASWKDRNIDTLRQSAKSSHKRLLRMVRKYRNLLAQPVNSTMQSGIPALELSIIPAHRSLNSDNANKLSAAVPIDVASWHDRPARYCNIGTTLRIMHSKVGLIDVAESESQRLATFMLDLNQSMTELRKATPSVRREENQALANHLKSRKRRLLADVLKELRTMGLQHNLAEDLTHSQASLAHVLAKLRCPIAENEGSPIGAAEYHLHRLLGLIPRAREAARKHSDDLTNGEIARCTALLESVLDVAVRQRNTLCRFHEEGQSLHYLVQRIRAFAASEAATVRGGLEDTSHPSEMQCCVVMIKTCIQLISIQAQLTKRDYTVVTSQFSDLASECGRIVAALESQPTLPDGIVGSAEMINYKLFAEKLIEIEFHKQSASRQHPELEYLLQHLQYWAPTPRNFPPRPNQQVSTDSSAWVGRLLHCLDRILTVMQNLGDVSSRSDDGNAWLKKGQQAIETAWNSLHVDDVSKETSELLSDLAEIRDHEQTLPAVAAICQNVLPLIDAYCSAVESVETAYCKLQCETLKLGQLLATAFATIAKEGFCSPPEKGEDAPGEAGEVESGTGLGEGEGAEDVSKDVGADEDLSELAQEATKQDRDGEMEDQKDAVDMADEDLEGDMGEADAGSEEENEDDRENNNDEDLDEETGEVNQDDANAIDEKMWDDGKLEEQQDKEASSGKGTAEKDDLSAAKDVAELDQKATQDDAEHGEEDDEDQMSTAEGENVERPEIEAADPHMQEQENLELPDDMDLEGEQNDADDLSDLEADLDDNMRDRDEEVGGRDEGFQEEVVEKPVSEAESEDGNTAHEAGSEAEETMPEERDTEGLLQDKDHDDDQIGSPTEGAVAGEQGSGQEDSTVDAEGGTSATENDVGAEKSEMEQQASGVQGDAEHGQNEEATSSTDPSAPDEIRSQFKQLGDVLEQWYKQNRPIDAAKQTGESETGQQEDTDISTARFEHLPNDEAAADTQALGAGSAEQSTTLNEDNSIPVNRDEATEDLPFQEDGDVEHEEAIDEQQNNNEPLDAREDFLQEQKAKAFVGAPTLDDGDIPMEDIPDIEEEIEIDDVKDVDAQMTNTRISDVEDAEALSMAEARQRWSQHESRTRNLSLLLTEHLRLILQPTQATKMRGDFRTGKRLNIKKIIPYIASSYKRDKIWMRRSVPSKRAYQILLAIDDSKSMAESDGGSALAFDTLALVARSLTALEAGELGVLAFGRAVTVAHDFATPFTADAGPEVVRRFTFAQPRTDVRRLLAESLELFRAARLRATASSADLWQLQLIISDGVCEDHPGIRQLVRQAHEERIMIVFIVVDAAAAAATSSRAGQTGGQSAQSILDLQTAEFARDAAGEMQLKMVKYMDTFPFRYYLIVRDVQELPAVLAGALRQWFAEVVETGP